MTELILYILLAIIQGQGGQAEVFGTEEDCLTQRAEHAANPGVLAVSDCVKVSLVRNLPKT